MMGAIARLATVAAIALPAALLDQATKEAARQSLVYGEVVPLLPFANLRLGFNPGISFGLFPASGAGVSALIAMTLAVVAGLVVWSVWTRDKRESGALSLIVGGATGNLIDRIRDGAVTDFIDIHAAGYHWPTFNVADAAITLGAVLLVVDAFRPGAQPKHETA